MLDYIYIYVKKTVSNYKYENEQMYELKCITAMTPHRTVKENLCGRQCKKYNE